MKASTAHRPRAVLNPFAAPRFSPSPLRVSPLCSTAFLVVAGEKRPSSSSQASSLI
jgi:hypothetical protein